MSEFDCEFCVRWDDPHYTGPTVEDDGNPLEAAEILEHYNERRYCHYMTDFSTARGLRGHLEARARYWTSRPVEGAGSGKSGMEELNSALQCIEATVDLWQRRHDAKLRARREANRKQQALPEAVAS